MHLHLNFSGELTGDMFIAAVLDAFSQYEQRVIAAIDALDASYPVVCSLVAHSDCDVSGHRFEIESFVKYFGHIPLAFPQEPARWESVRARLNAAEIRQEVRTHATKIFELMLRAEAAVNGILPERVAFEAGAWNSIAQVVGAATLIDALGEAQWSASLLRSGGAAERSGAAILEYLCPERSRGRPSPKAGSLVRSGTGFGVPGSEGHYVRLLCFDAGGAALREPDDTQAPGRPASRAAQQTGRP